MMDDGMMNGMVKFSTLEEQVGVRTLLYSVSSPHREQIEWSGGPRCHTYIDICSTILATILVAEHERPVF